MKSFQELQPKDCASDDRFRWLVYSAGALGEIVIPYPLDLPWPVPDPFKQLKEAGYVIVSQHVETFEDEERR